MGMSPLESKMQLPAKLRRIRMKKFLMTSCPPPFWNPNPKELPRILILLLLPTMKRMKIFLKLCNCKNPNLSNPLLKSYLKMWAKKSIETDCTSKMIHRTKRNPHLKKPRMKIQRILNFIVFFLGHAL